MEHQGARRPVAALRALGGMLANPGATFASFPARQPWFGPLLLFSCIGAVSAALVASVVANAFAAQAAAISQQAGLPAAEAGSVTQIVRWVSLGTGAVVGFLRPFFHVLATTLIVWALAMVLGQRFAFAQVFAVATYAYLPHVFGTLVFTGLTVGGVYDVVAMGGALPPSLKVLIPEATGGFVAGLAQRIELFGLWSTVLLGIGLAAAAHRTARWGIGAAVAAWLLLALAGSALGSLGPALTDAPGLDGGISRPIPC